MKTVTPRPHIIPPWSRPAHRGDLLAQYASNNFPCIEKALVGRTPSHLLYASSASAQVDAISGGNSRHLCRLLSQDSSRTLGDTGHLGAITTTPPSPLEEQAEIFIQESGRSDNAHYVFHDGHWTKAAMRAHPLITVCVSMDNSWCRTRHGPTVARNAPAIVDTGAQTNAWSLRHFLAAGFDRSMLILHQT